ncbi:MAG: VWA domain-containing protein [Methylococcaceae bacterium]|nr:VWA domain-containing protein [Methylococcaceae bacterium]
MIKHLIISIIMGLLPNTALAIAVTAPQELQISYINISDPDQYIKTLGEVAFIIDLSASHDDLLALKVRRSSLKLKNNQPFTAFAVHRKAGIIVIAGGDTTHMSIASIDNNLGIYDAQVLFYGKGNHVISPRPDDVAVFDINFKPLEFTYVPLQTPGSLEIPVSIALDTSGSMSGHMDTVVTATQDFMRELPKFTRCSLLSFNSDVNYLSSQLFKNLENCPSSSYLLNNSLQAGGATALYKAIKTGFRLGDFRSNQNFPNITIVVTDGKNTADYGDTLSTLLEQKKHSNSKLFVFWAGNYTDGYLKGLADLEFVSTKNLKSELDSFFYSLGVSLSGLQTLHIKK